ncbi:MAG TPA: hypothetical protein VH372_00255 [Actinospica sp.]|nr:hypothetical protein [Actinospica sp.]
MHRTGTAADFLSLAPMFLAGSLLCLYGSRVPVAWPYGMVALRASATSSGIGG